jgi:hypothetical protein
VFCARISRSFHLVADLIDRENWSMIDADVIAAEIEAWP